MKVLISFNESAYNKEKKAIEDIAAALLQPVIDKFNSLGIEPLSTGDFSKLFNDAPALVFDKITGGKLSIGGVLVDKTKAIEMIGKPNGYEELIQMIADVSKQLNGQHRQPGNIFINPQNMESFFSLTKEGKVILHDTLDERLKEVYNKYATSEKAKNVLTFCKSLKSIYNDNEIDKILANNGESLGALLNSLFEKNDTTGVIEIKEKGVLKFN